VTASFSWAYVRSWRSGMGTRNGRPDTPRGFAVDSSSAGLRAG
jgi:hypothetical protein